MIYREISDVSDWFSLGMELGLPRHTLSSIECDYNRLTRRIQAVIAAWLRCDTTASWSKLAQAVEAMDHRDIAERIRGNYLAGNYM